MIADRAAKIVRLRNERRTWRAVADAMGVALSTVQKHGYRAGAQHRTNRECARTERDRALQSLSLKRQGKSYAAIARALGVTRRHAIRLVARARRIDERRRQAGQL